MILQDYFPRVSGLTLVPASGGVFEVKLNDQLIYSKRQTGVFPDAEALMADIGTRLSS